MELTPGATHLWERTLEQRDFDRFAALSGDSNPIHLDPAYAAGTRFGRTIAHGMLLYGLIAAALADALPGARQLEQSLAFRAPAFAGERLAIKLTLTALLPAGRCRVRTTVRRTTVRHTTVQHAEGTEVLVDGESLLELAAGA